MQPVEREGGVLIFLYARSGSYYQPLV